MDHVELNSGTSKSNNGKSFYTFEDIDLQESHTKLHKKPSETLVYCLPRNFNGFPLYFAQCLLTEMKNSLFSFKTRPYRKILAKIYL